MSTVVSRLLQLRQGFGPLQSVVAFEFVSPKWTRQDEMRRLRRSIDSSPRNPGGHRREPPSSAAAAALRILQRGRCVQVPRGRVEYRSDIGREGKAVCVPSGYHICVPCFRGWAAHHAVGPDRQSKHHMLHARQGRRGGGGTEFRAALSILLISVRQILCRWIVYGPVCLSIF